MARKKYNIDTTDGSDVGSMCAELLGRLDGTETIVRLVFFGNPADNAEYAAQLATINARVAERFGDKCPAVTYVAQKPLQGQFKMETTALDRNAGGDIDVKYGEANYLVLTDLTGKELVVGGIVADDLSADAITQSDNVFGRLRRIMDAEGFPVNSIARQWNYVEGITEFDGERQHYQDFNDARSRFYATTSWPSGYPAATGIGTRMGGIMVELNALIKGEGIIDMPLDNLLQVAAHSYSQDVLLGAVDCELQQKTTPKFERARLIGYPDNATVYISGTAAIRGEDSLTGSDVTHQTRITMENIEFLCSPDNINSRGPVVTGRERTFRLLRVYIKNPDHLGKVKEYMDANYGDVPKFYLYADVCRTELLVEIEGVASIQ